MRMSKSACLVCLMLLSATVWSTLCIGSVAQGQDRTPATTATPTPTPQAKGKDADPTGETAAELALLVYGSRAGLSQIRRNGIERGRITRPKEDGTTEELTYERRFVRGETIEKDKIRIDQKSPTLDYSLLYDAGQVQGIVNGTVFTPREDTIADFKNEMNHGIDALLRYKENGSTVTFVRKDKQKNLDLWIVDLATKTGERTRYYISAKSYRVLYLEYEQPASVGAEAVTYRRTFHDYRYAQGTLVPFRTVLYVKDKQLAEARILTVTYGVKMEDAVFRAGAPNAS